MSSPQQFGQQQRSLHQHPGRQTDRQYHNPSCRCFTTRRSRWRASLCRPTAITTSSAIATSPREQGWLSHARLDCGGSCRASSIIAPRVVCCWLVNPYGHPYFLLVKKYTIDVQPLWASQGFYVTLSLFF